MVELAHAAGHWQVGYGGDTLNVAIHLARGGHDVAYLSALGTDPFSRELRHRWAAEGLDTSLVLEHPRRNAGLYAITNDAAGERSFVYWRETSAAREMFELGAMAGAMERCLRADLFHFSLISLAILPDAGRRTLLGLAARIRAGGGRVAFDGNYRPELWRSAEVARAARAGAIAVADFGLPTLDDERALGGAASPEAVVAEWRALGCGETVVKLGAEGCYLPDGRVIAPERALVPVDTSGAGDAFDAGYLGARIGGASIEDAARAGNALAGWTIMRPGAIPPRDPR